MKALFLAIQAQLVNNLVLPDGIKFNTASIAESIIWWNNQVRDFEKLTQMGVPLPFIAIEFMSYDIKQLGNGDQFYDNLIIRVHIVKEFYAPTDGLSVNTDLTMPDLKDAVYQCLQKFEPQGAAQFIRRHEKPNHDFDNLVIWEQEYKTNYIDFLMDEPVAGISNTPTYEVDVTIQEP